MAIPLLLALAGMAANEMSEDEMRQAEIEAQNEQERLDNEALARAEKEKRKKERQMAMARYLQPPTIPAGVGDYVFRPPKEVKPDLRLSNLLGDLGAIGPLIGAYTSGSVKTEKAPDPVKNTGGESYYRPVLKGWGGY